MSTVGYAQRRGVREIAAKERRKKFLAFGGIGVLGLVLVIQVPKTLDMLKSDGSSATSPSVVVTPSATPQPAAEAPRPRPRFLRTARVDDPFAGSRAGAGESRPGAVGAPAGLRDPFQLRSATPAPPAVRVPQRIVVGTPGTRAPRIGYTVVLASIPTSNSRAVAVRFARTARARGVVASAYSGRLLEPAARWLLGRVQRHVPQRRRRSARRSASSRARLSDRLSPAARPVLGASGRDHLDSRA